MTIAGSDSGGGAGIQADLKTFAALGVYGASALTAITAQNTIGVTAVHEAPPDIIAAQIDAVIADIGADAVKTGMLASGPIVAVVADAIRRHRIANLVVDPVMVAKAATACCAPRPSRPSATDLLPLAAVVTPNLPEAAELTGQAVATDAEMRDAAAKIIGMGARSVSLKAAIATARQPTCFTTASSFGSSPRSGFLPPAPTAPDAPSLPQSPPAWPTAWQFPRRWHRPKSMLPPPSGRLTPSGKGTGRCIIFTPTGANAARGPRR